MQSVRTFAACLIIGSTIFCTNRASAQIAAPDPDLVGFAHGSSWPGSLNLISPRLVLGAQHSTPPLGERIVFANGETATIVGILDNDRPGTVVPGTSDLRLYILDRALPIAMVMPMWQTIPTFLNNNGNLPAGTRFKRAGYHSVSDWNAGYSSATWLTRYSSDPLNDLYVADVAVGSPVGFSGRIYSSTSNGVTLGYYDQVAPAPIVYPKMVGYSGSPFLVYDATESRFKLAGTTTFDNNSGSTVCVAYSQDWITWANQQSSPVDGGLQGSWIATSSYNYPGSYAEKIYDLELGKDVISTHATSIDASFYKLPYFSSFTEPYADVAHSGRSHLSRLHFKVKGNSPGGMIYVQIKGNAGRPFTLIYYLNTADAAGSAGAYLHKFNLSSGVAGSADENVADGFWHTIERDLADDAMPYMKNPTITGNTPDNAFDSAISFAVRGSNLQIADVELLPSQTEPSSDLVGYWRMNEAWWWKGQPEQVRDESGNRYHGVATDGANIAQDAQFGAVGNFNGSSGYINIGTTQTYTALTIAAWVKVGSSADAPIFGSYADQETTLIVQNGNLQFGLGGWVDGVNAIRNAGAIPVGRWTHVAVTWQAGIGFTAYIDGVKTKTVTTTLTSWTWPKLVIGARRPLYPVAWFNGCIDEAIIYNRALSDDEIANLRIDSRRFGFWKMDEPSWNSTPFVVGDSSGYLNAGTPIGSPQTMPSNHGRAGVFNGVGDGIRTPITRTFGALTIAGWIRIQGSANQPIIGSNDDPSTTFILTNGNIQLALGGWSDGANAIRDGGSVPLDQWTHVAVTWESGVGFNAYVNGVKTKTAATTLTNWTWPTLVIGTRRPSYPLDWFNGQIDELSIWDRALSAADITRIANAP